MIRYDEDIIAWANEQASLLRAGRWDLIHAHWLIPQGLTSRAAG